MESLEDTERLLERMDEFTRLYRKLNGMLLNHFNLTESSVALFDIIGDEQLSLKAITQAGYLDKSTVSRQVNTLVEKGMVVKTGGADKRYAYFKLTTKAKSMYAAYKRESQRAFSDLMGSMTEAEQQKLSILLNRLNRLYKSVL